MGLINYIRKISTEHETWALAIRKKADKPLYLGNASDFHLLNRSGRYWRADPFLVKYKNKNYVFCEMYDRKLGRGVIGVAKVAGNKVGHFRVCLKLPYHLSYPYVFEENGIVYMIPECCESGKVSMYKCVHFPDKWEYYKEISDSPCVDTTPVYDDKISYFAAIFDEINGGNDNLCLIDNVGKVRKVKVNDPFVRPAGALIRNEKLIRPSQDCSITYGCGLFFNYVTDLSVENYSEIPYLRICPPGYECNDNEVNVKVSGLSDRDCIIGIHTYNSNDDYEIIDVLLQEQKSFTVFWKNREKLFQYLKKRIVNRIKKKY